jgi:hypothetical protein
MDVKKFRDSRNTELSDFKKTYDFLKTEYSSALASAIEEQDPSQQQILIDRVQQINSQLTNEIHSISNDIHKGTAKFDPIELDELTADLIKYQKEYSDIEKSKDKAVTLKNILQKTSSNLKTATYTYYIYVAILMGLAGYISYLVLVTSLQLAFPRSTFTKTRGLL